MTVPEKCLEAMESWEPIASETLPEFDFKKFVDQYSNHAAVLEDLRGALGSGIVEDIILILEHEEFLKGPKGNLLHDGFTNRRKIEIAVEQGVAIEVVIPSFAGRPHNPAAHRRVSPDLGEVYALLRLWDISRAVQSVYVPGIKFTLILDGKIYRPFYGYSHDEAVPYQRNLDKQIEKLGAAGFLRTVDMWDLYEARRTDVDSIEGEVREYVTRQWNDADLPARKELIAALRQGVETTPITVALIEMYKSGSYRQVDLKEFFDRAEQCTLARAEHAAYEYTVLLTVMRRLELVQRAFPHAIRGTVHPKPDQYSPIMRSADTVVSPWHGTAILRLDGEIVTEYEAIIFQEPSRYKAWFIDGDEAPFFYEEIAG
ncbi:L-tyrosine/L-tryptophan isonitrile synthase family protein [Corynebacterium lizhenjunii]|uniref:L-tyrosine/L-tryptophan isonitrile synthase family protein n=1 Tax=Corynebacterium lizhenjunii TaxID=2709394 RepID=A0A7T0P9Z5_9CORY|nr:L-tyrosine/L-tryptophan isonitrile synthase family protein [Corynebacterium lizhenjunii]QPK79303.1 L-tyrosine/L-tryptophan isonitrile synthase family protein [Corynebacterium lizhenjunii]